MNKYSVTLTKKFTFDEGDMLDIISSAVYDIGYWAVIDNDTDVWNAAREALPEDRTFEDVFWAVLKSGKAVTMYDAEDDEEVWELTLDKLCKGIQKTIENNQWDGDLDTIDGLVGDMIFQYALFEEIVYG